MKHLFWFALTLSIVASACKSEDSTLNNILEADKATAINEAGISTAVEDFPGKIPGNHKVLLMGMQPEVYKWKDFADYLQYKIHDEKKEHYYNNLEWITISSIVESEEFYNEATDDIKEMIWKRMEARHWINYPDNALKLIQSMKNLTDTERANRLHLVEIKNKHNFKDNAENLKAHFEKYKGTYLMITSLTYDRWGKPLFDEK